MRTRALVVLTLINMFNYIDRWMVPPLFESLKREPILGHPSDARLGSLMTAFVIVYTVASPVFGLLGDRMRRTRLIAAGVAVWSLATATAGLAASFLMLFLARATVGIGEAAYGTIAPALLSDYYEPDRRGRVMAIFACAIPIGSALGYVIGGLVDTHFGWRAAFFVAGLPGLLLAALVFTVGDPPRGVLDNAPVDEEPKAPPLVALRNAYAALSKNRLYVLTSLGYLEVFEQRDADHYDRIARYPTPSSSQTGLFVPQWGRLFVAVRAQSGQNAEVRIYQAHRAGESHLTNETTKPPRE